VRELWQGGGEKEGYVGGEEEEEENEDGKNREAEE
jgi:hypothetical protein